MTGTSTLLTDGSGAADFLGQGSCRFALVEYRSERGIRPARRGDRPALQRGDRGSRAIISRRAGRFRSRCSAPKGRSKMSVGTGIGAPPGYFARLIDVVRRLAGAAGARAVAFAPRRGGAASGAPHVCGWRRPVRPSIVALMVVLDAYEIGLMPPRGTAGAVAGSHPHRFRQMDVTCCGCWRRSCSLSALIAPRLRGDAAIAADQLRNAHPVRVFRGPGAGARRRGHQICRRARPAVRRWRGQCVQVRALRRNRGLCELSVRPCGRPPWRWRLR